MGGFGGMGGYGGYGGFGRGGFGYGGLGYGYGGFYPGFYGLGLGYGLGYGYGLGGYGLGYGYGHGMAMVMATGGMAMVDMVVWLRLRRLRRLWRLWRLWTIPAMAATAMQPMRIRIAAYATSVPASGSFGYNSAYVAPTTATSARQRRYLGIDEEPMVGSDGSKAMKISNVYPGTAAEKAGLKAGDILRSANGYLTEQRGNLAWIIANATPNNLLKLNVQTAATERPIKSWPLFPEWREEQGADSERLIE